MYEISWEHSVDLQILTLSYKMKYFCQLTNKYNEDYTINILRLTKKKARRVK